MYFSHENVIMCASHENAVGEKHCPVDRGIILDKWLNFPLDAWFVALVAPPPRVTRDPLVVLSDSR